MLVHQARRKLLHASRMDIDAFRSQFAIDEIPDGVGPEKAHPGDVRAQPRQRDGDVAFRPAETE